MKRMAWLRSGFLCLLFFVVIVPCQTLAAETGAASGKSEAPSAKVSLEFGQGSFILSTSGGQGTLLFKGREYPFKIGSVGFGGLGVSKVTATGEVYNLKRLEDFPGAYAQVRMGYAAGAGKGAQALRNANGVEIRLQTVTKGVALNLGADGMFIEFGKIRK